MATTSEFHQVPEPDQSKGWQRGFLGSHLESEALCIGFQRIFACALESPGNQHTR